MYWVRIGFVITAAICYRCDRPVDGGGLPLKRQSVFTRVHDPTSQKTVVCLLASMRTLNVTNLTLFSGRTTTYVNEKLFSLIFLSLASLFSPLLLVLGNPTVVSITGVSLLGNERCPPSLPVLSAMDEVRHALWLLDRKHINGNAGFRYTSIILRGYQAVRDCDSYSSPLGQKTRAVIQNTVK